MGSCRARSVYLTTGLLGRLRPLCGYSVLCTFFRQKLTTALLEWKGENDRRKYFIIKSPRKNVADLGGVCVCVGGIEPITSWSLVGCASNWAIEAGLPSCVNICISCVKRETLLCIKFSAVDIRISFLLFWHFINIINLSSADLTQRVEDRWIHFRERWHFFAARKQTGHKSCPPRLPPSPVKGENLPSVFSPN